MARRTSHSYHVHRLAGVEVAIYVGRESFGAHDTAAKDGRQHAKSITVGSRRRAANPSNGVIDPGSVDSSFLAPGQR